MLRLGFCLAALVLAARANPLVAYTPPPLRDLVMVSEWVVVTVHRDDARVTGRYVFRQKPDAPKDAPRPKHAIVELPVPVQDGMSLEEIRRIFQPRVIVANKELTEEAKEIRLSSSFSFGDRKLTLATFSLTAPAPYPGDELVIAIAYRQPFLDVDGAAVAFYVPMLPDFGRYADQMKLRAADFPVEFKAADGVLLRTAATKDKPTDSLVFTARDEVALGVERIIGPDAPR